MGARLQQQQVDALVEQVVPAADLEGGSDSSPQAVSNTLWAVATMKHPLNREQLQRLLTAHVQELPQPESNPQCISNTLWAAATLKADVPTDALEAIFDTLAARLHSAEPQALSNALWAAASLHPPFLPRQLLKDPAAVKFIVEVLLPGMKIQELSNCAGVFDRLAVEDHVQLFQLHMWLTDCRQAGLKGMLSQQQLGKCREAWLQLMEQRTQTSRLQENVYKAVQQLPWLQEVALEWRTADGLLSADIYATAAAPANILQQQQQRQQRQVVIEVDGPWHFRRPDQALTGTTHFRNRVLAARGLVVVSLPWWKWRSLDTWQDKVEWLEQMVQTALAAAVELAVGTDTCQLSIYNADKGKFTHTFDPGHIQGVACAEFLPGTGGKLLVTAGPARDIRVVDLERQAVRPYSSHAATIRTILPLSGAVFASGAEDGTIRCFDSRIRGCSDDSSQASSSSLLVDQRHEAVGRPGGKPSVQSMSRDPLNTQYIATGGGDSLVRVYDVRMMRQPGSAALGYSRSRPPPWCYCLAPAHMRDGNAAACSLRPSSIASVAFDHTGQRLLASYTGKDVYSFDAGVHCVAGG
ncbi:hypothetical protein OEZ86_007854 [Tetradesmus obliquus]|nr:hypothetical protein OEZ86_007854 [Tetradesmus obliquus]